MKKTKQAKVVNEDIMNGVLTYWTTAGDEWVLIDHESCYIGRVAPHPCGGWVAYTKDNTLITTDNDRHECMHALEEYWNE